MVGVRGGNDRAGRAGPPPLASVHLPHPPLRVVSPRDGLSQIRDGEEERPRKALGQEEEPSAQGLGGPHMVRWPQKSSQKDTVCCFCSEAAGVLLQDALCGCHHGPPRYTVQGSLGGVRDHRVGGLSSLMWLRAGPCPSLQWPKGWRRSKWPQRAPWGLWRPCCPHPLHPPQLASPRIRLCLQGLCSRARNQGEQSEALGQNLKEGWRKSESSR